MTTNGNGYYDYDELGGKAIDSKSTIEDRLNLVDWLYNYDTKCYNGESYDIGDGLLIRPIFKEIDDDIYEIVDAEILR